MRLGRGCGVGGTTAVCTVRSARGSAAVVSARAVFTAACAGWAGADTDTVNQPRGWAGASSANVSDDEWPIAKCGSKYTAALLSAVRKRFRAAWVAAARLSPRAAMLSIAAGKVPETSISQ